MVGTIKTLQQTRGFGFIKAEREDYFMHCSALLNCGIEDLAPGDKVEFEIGERRGRKQAISVRALF